MKQTWKWIAVAVLAGVAIYLGTLVVTAQQPGSKPDASAETLEAITKKLDDVSKRLDEMSKKLDTIQSDLDFVKARGKC